MNKPGKLPVSNHTKKSVKRNIIYQCVDSQKHTDLNRVLIGGYINVSRVDFKRNLSRM